MNVASLWTIFFVFRMAHCGLADPWGVVADGNSTRLVCICWRPNRGHLQLAGRQRGAEAAVPIELGLGLSVLHVARLAANQSTLPKFVASPNLLMYRKGRRVRAYVACLGFAWGLYDLGKVH
jgi:hypothetical protein